MYYINNISYNIYIYMLLIHIICIIISYNIYIEYYRHDIYNKNLLYII